MLLCVELKCKLGADYKKKNKFICYYERPSLKSYKKEGLHLQKKKVQTIRHPVNRA